MRQPVLCVDVGSTYTKAVLVDLAESHLLATASHPTTLPVPGERGGRGVLDGVAAVYEKALLAAGLADDSVIEVLTCSSAGGGLRLAVVGYEPQVSAEAARRVALSAGGRVVHVHGGRLDGATLATLRAAHPDVVLLVGGTDGGNAEVLLHNAHRLSQARWATPIVLAGNAEAADAAESVLQRTGRRVTVTANVLPRIGVIHAAPARAAIREAFLAHVIGGKHLARGRFGGSTFTQLVRAATPDAVLAGVEVLADGAPAAGIDSCGDVIVVDIGGATTDVYSVITPLGEDATLAKDVVAQLWRARTVEGDLGMRWGATGVVEAAIAEHLGSASFQWTEHAHRVRADIGWLPATAADRMAETRVAAMAALIAMRRHARPATATSGPRPLREVGAVIGSGGVLRHGDDDLRRAVLEPLTTDHGGGWRVPERAELMVDDRYVLFAAGLLAPSAPIAAAALAATGLSRVPRRP